jgi:pimeloyl-ACP methyl ester carboxylesterase
MMATGSAGARLIAVDLPGTGGSAGVSTDGTKTAVAGVIHQLIQVMGLTGVTLAGQDIGGMVVFAYLRRFGGLAKAAIMDVVIPGLDPWDEVLRNPYLWHFAFHSIPNLPELLVEGRERRYFDYFFDQLATHPAAITDAARNQYAAAYRAPGALSQPGLTGTGPSRVMRRRTSARTARSARRCSACAVTVNAATSTPTPAGYAPRAL